MADTTEFRSPPYYSTCHHTFEKTKAILRLQSNPFFPFWSFFPSTSVALFSFSYYYTTTFHNGSRRIQLKRSFGISHRSLRSHQEATELFIPNLISDIPLSTQSHRIHGQRRLQRSPLAERTRWLQLSPPLQLLPTESTRTEKAALKLRHDHGFPPLFQFLLLTHQHFPHHFTAELTTHRILNAIHLRHFLRKFETQAQKGAL